MARGWKPVRVGKRPHKYAAEAIVSSVDGFRYDSKGECRYGDQLVMLQRSGSIRLLLRQVPFHLPGGTKLVIDFVWIGGNGDIHFEDFKGVETEAFKVKKREVEAHYDIEIDVIKRESRR